MELPQLIHALPIESMKIGAMLAWEDFHNGIKPEKLGYKLLTPPTGNAKLAKNSLPTYGLTLAPAGMSGYQVCPSRSIECEESCLGVVSGRSRFNTVRQSRIKKTRLLVAHHRQFFGVLYRELFAAYTKYGSRGWAFRSNVLSDINWGYIAPHIYSFRSVNYDYTKRMDIPSHNNLHITFSYSGRNLKNCLDVLSRGHNVAVVCSNKDDVLSAGFFTFPEDPEERRWEVIDGDISDERFKDPPNCIVLLRPKGSVTPSSKFITQGKTNGKLCIACHNQ